MEATVQEGTNDLVDVTAHHRGWPLSREPKVLPKVNLSPFRAINYYTAGFVGKGERSLIAGNTPTGGYFQNPRSRNLGPPYKRTQVFLDSAKASTK